MEKYRINKAQGGGFNLYRMHDTGMGWYKEFVSHYETKEEAEKTVTQITSFFIQGGGADSGSR